MSARYEIKVCGCGSWARLHFVLILPNGREVIFTALAAAIESVAEAEARRIAGRDWTLRWDGPFIEALRVGDLHPVRERTWERMALFLREWRAADRKVVAA